MGLLVLGALSAALSTGTFASFNATTSNSAQVTTATLVLGNKANGGTECFSAGSGTQTITAANSNTCDNAFAATLLEPGTPTVTAQIDLLNDGNVSGTHLWMFLPSCTNSATYQYTDSFGNKYSGSGSLCTATDVNVWTTDSTFSTTNGNQTCLYGGGGNCLSFDNTHTLSSFSAAHGGAGSLDLLSAPLAASGHKYVVIQVQLDSSANNSYQALQASGAFNFELVQ